jgi:hypothetical protein
LNSTQKIVLFISFLPYLSLAAYDGWLHEKARKVPKVEQGFHALLALSLVALLWSLFSSQSEFALISLGVFATAAIVDELGFHQQLARHERRLHHLAYGCFSLFIVVAFWLKAF